MVDFKESFIKGLGHAEKVEEQRRVIDEIVQRMIDEVSEATDGKLNIELQSQSAYEKQVRYCSVQCFCIALSAC